MRVPLILSALFVGALAVAADQSDGKLGLVARQDQRWKSTGGRDQDWGKSGRDRDWGKGGRDGARGKSDRDGGWGKGGRDWDGDWNDDFDPPRHGPNHRPQRPVPRPRPHPPPPPPRPNVCKKYYALCHRQWDQCQIDDTPPSRGPLFDFEPITRYAILEADNCNPFACLPAIAVAPCILSAIARGDPVGLSRCSDKICECSDCIPGLNPFLDRYRQCRRERSHRCGKGHDGKDNRDAGKDNGNGKDNGKGGKDNGKGGKQNGGDSR